MCLSLLGFFTLGMAQTSTNSTVDQAKKASEEVMETHQDETIQHWKFSGTTTLNTASTHYSNWAAGGNSNINTVAAVNMTLVYKKSQSVWESNLDTDFGMQYIEDNKFDWRKSADKFNFYSKYGYQLASQWYVTAMGSFRSQYAEGYKYTTTDGIESRAYNSEWMAPAYIDLSLGMDWKPNDIFSVYISPAAGRLVVCKVEELREAYGVDLDKTHYTEFGAATKASVNYEGIDHLKLKSALTLFTPYGTNFGKVDVDWDTDITYVFKDVFNVSFKSSLKYYDKVMVPDDNGILHHRVQWMSMLGIGLGYSF